MRCAPFVFAAGMVWLEVLGGLWVAGLWGLGSGGWGH